MKKLKIFVILSALIGMLLAFYSCGAKRLVAPSDFEIDEENVLSWEEVEGAKKYAIEILNMETNEIVITEDSWGKEYYELSVLEEGDYDIKIKSLGDGRTYSDSNWSEPLPFQKKYETGCIYRLINGRTAYEIKSAGSASGDVFIEDVYRGKDVVSIADKAFKGKKTIVNVVVGANVTNIGKNAFYNCPKLETVKLPEGLETIGESAFNSCASLKSINIPEGIKVINNFTFSYCRKLASINAPEETTASGETVLSSVAILPDGLETIGEDAFSNCSAITSLTIPDSVTSIADGAFKATAALQTVKLGDGLTSIAGNVFKDCVSLQTVTFGTENNLKTIGESAFEKCSALVSIVIPEGVESLGLRCFYSCALLQTVELPTTLKTVGGLCFNATKLYVDGINDLGFVYVDDWLIACSDDTLETVEEIVSENAEETNYDNVFYLKEGTVGLADGVFTESTTLVRVELPASVKYLGSEAFAGCEELLEFTTAKNGLVEIGSFAFAVCEKLKYLNLQEGLETIGEYAFYNCEKLTDKDNLIPSTVTRIEKRAFEGTDLWNYPSDTTGLIYAGNWVVGYNLAAMASGAVTLKDDTVGVADYAFYQCYKLTSISGLRNVEYIGRGAFYQCFQLSIVQLNANLEKIEDYTFYGCWELGTVYFSRNLKEIGRSAFYECQSLNTVNLASTYVEKIGPYAFYNCTGIREVAYGPYLKDIGDYAFYKCNALTTLSVPDNVERIGVRAFNKCENLQTITIGAVETIDDYAFYGCSNLQMINIGDGVKAIGNYAFYNCKTVQMLTIGSGVETIGDYAFYGLENILKITLPESLKSIGKYAFKGAAKVSSMILESSVTEIEENAFYGCNEMTIYTDAMKTAEGGFPTGWHYRWNSGYRPVVWGCTLAEDENGSYVVSVAITANTLDNVNATGGLQNPMRAGYTFLGWATQSGATEAEYTADELVNVPVGTTVYAVWEAM